jgi:hypothetical protein
MPVTVGQTIGEAEYTTLRSNINLVMGTPTGTGVNAAGYNQTTTSPAVSPGDKITVVQWNALKFDVDKAYAHQVGSAPSPALATVNADTGITKAIHDAIETVVTFVKDAGNRFSLGPGQSTTVSARSAAKGPGWNGTQTHDVTFTWANANAVKAFFNAGGKLTFTSSLSYTGSESKTLDWQTMMDPGTITMNYIDEIKSGANGTITNSAGYYDLTTTEVEILNRNGATPYSENRYKIFARAITNGVRIRMQYQDNDVGDQRPGFLPGPPVDENVQGTLTSAMSYIRPTGSNVQVDAPTIATGNTNTF